MDDFKMDNLSEITSLEGNNNNEPPEQLNTSYSNKKIYKKFKRKKKNILFQLILVSLVSSVLGGVVGSYLHFSVPPSKSATSNLLENKSVFVPKQNLSQSLLDASKVLAAQSQDSPLTSITAIAEKVSPSIVGIKVTVPSQNSSSDFGIPGFSFDTPQEPQIDEGSGIIIKSDGYIMTNNHVIEGALDTSTGKLMSDAKIEVFLPTQTDTPYTAQVIGHDTTTDLAVIKIDATNLTPAEFGDSDNVKVGELAVAIGNPGGLEYMGSVTAGIISGLNRTVEGSDNQEYKLIQTDAAINPGNSGGALVNSSGQVIGINSVKIVAQGFEGLGFAIPINKAKEIIDSLIQYQYVKGRIQLGIAADSRYTEDVAKQNNMPVGVYVSDVTLLSGAYKAGIQVGDVITKFDGQSVKTVDDINSIKEKHKIGDVVPVEIYRDNTTLTVQVTLTENKGN